MCDFSEFPVPLSYRPLTYHPITNETVLRTQYKENWWLNKDVNKVRKKMVQKRISTRLGEWHRVLRKSAPCCHDRGRVPADYCDRESFVEPGSFSAIAWSLRNALPQRIYECSGGGTHCPCGFDCHGLKEVSICERRVSGTLSLLSSVCGRSGGNKYWNIRFSTTSESCFITV